MLSKHLPLPKLISLLIANCKQHKILKITAIFQLLITINHSWNTTVFLQWFADDLGNHGYQYPVNEKHVLFALKEFVVRILFTLNSLL